jgi:hypothetical protein
MTVIQQPEAYRGALLGNGPVSKATGTLAATTVALFTISGGEVLVTAMWGVVTTSITVANSYKLQFNPTTGDTQDLAVATDIGGTDTLAGSLITTGLGTATAPRKIMTVGYSEPLRAVVSIGQIEHVSAGTDGAITWYLTWVPLTTGARLVAA